MFIFPQEIKGDAQVERGPNIGEPPRNDVMPAALKGVAMIKVGDKITTDHIMPAGSRLKYRSNVPKYATFVFENIDATFPQRCMANREKGMHNIIIAGESYGQGSSREHAALCPMYLGVKVVVAKSFERIHAANLVNFGIVPLVFVNGDDYEKIDAGDELQAPDWKQAIERGNNIKLKDVTKDMEIECTYNLSGRQRSIVLAGGLLNYTNQ
jgi:aconitate hydratase